MARRTEGLIDLRSHRQAVEFHKARKDPRIESARKFEVLVGKSVAKDLTPGVDEREAARAVATVERPVDVEE